MNAQVRSEIERLEPRRLLTSVLFVDTNSPGPTHDGSSWATAYTDLQQALLGAVAGDEIRVADGTYVPGTSTSDTFALKNGVALRGGYAGFGAATPDARDPVLTPSILSGPAIPFPVIFTSIVTASSVDSTTVLDGFNIGPSPLAFNVGLYCTNASPYVQNCTFTGLLYSAAQIRNGSPVFVDCTFSNNSAGYGGAINNQYSSVTAVNCTFIGNRCTTSKGGAIYSIDSQLTLTQCRFIRNTNSRNVGGAVYAAGNGKFTNCEFYGNSSIDGGGAMCAYGMFSIVNCAFVGNRSNGPGAISGDLYEIRRSTFTQNRSAFIGAAFEGSASRVEGSIFWNNPAYANAAVAASINHFYANDIQGGWSGGDVSIDANPLFVRDPSPGGDGTWGTADDDYGNLQLQPYSPCIDIGHDGSLDDLSTAKDLAGNPRLVDFPGVTGFGESIDMGAYETPAALIALSATFDVNAPKPSVRITLNIVGSIGGLQSSDLELTNLTTGQEINTNIVADAVHDQPARTVTWLITPGLLPDGDYRAALSGGAFTISGQPLAAGFTTHFFFLSGDADRDRDVDINDLGILASNWQQSPRTFSQGDFDYSGTVDVDDLGMLASNWQQQLSASAPSAPPTRRSTQRVFDQVLGT